MKNVNKLLFLWILNLLTLSLFAQEEIHMKVFKGEAILPFIKDISDLSLEIYREYPYLYDGTEEEYLPFIEFYAKSKCGIACLLFEQSKPIGVAIGMPMREMREKYRIPFTNTRSQVKCEEVFYLGEFLLLREYRNLGLGKQMYLEFENSVREEGFKKISFCKIVETEQDPLKPKNYKSLDGFWRKLGFEMCDDMTVSVLWRNIFESEETPHSMIYWIKSISLE